MYHFLLADEREIAMVLFGSAYPIWGYSRDVYIHMFCYIYPDLMSNNYILFQMLPHQAIIT